MTVNSSVHEMKSEEFSAQGEKKSRSKCPGVRLVGSRIYDSQNGKSCHQCRQKTRDFAAGCKNQKGNKQCCIYYCHKCLLNRYGENAEEVDLLGDWKCPKCRGICNCSCCMKKRGHKPTGILVHTAKENGFSSVSELLQIKGPENFGHDRIKKDVDVPLSKPASSKESAITSPRKPGKENSFDGSNDLSVHSQNLTPVSNKKKSKKTKREELQEVNNCNRDDGANLEESGQKKPRRPEEVSKNGVQINEKDDFIFVEKSKYKIQSKGIPKEDKKEEGVFRKEKKSKTQPQDVSKKEITVNGKVVDDFMEEKKFKKHMLKDVVVCIVASTQKDAKNCKSGAPNGFKNDNLKTNKKTALGKEKFKKLKPKDIVVCLMANTQKDAKNCKNGAANGVKYDDLKTNSKTALDWCKNNKCTAELQSKEIDINLPLPPSTLLTTVAGIQLPHEDAGQALQFFEFCAAFSEVLDLRKGQAEAVIREIIFGRRGRRSQGSLLVQFHIKLLSLIQEDIGEKCQALSPANGQNSWLKALGKCISECKFMSIEFPSDCFDKGNEVYDLLNTSQKFKLLNFLCDEALNTGDLRSWIDDQNSKFVQREKEAKEKVLAAKDKEKQLKQKMQDEVANAIIAKNGAPFSVSEHEAIVSRIKKEAGQAHAEMLEAMGMVPKKRQRSDAVRTDPVLLDVNGHTFWRLKGYNVQPDILLQDIGNWSSVVSEEKWFVYDTEQKQGIEKYISLMTKRLRIQNVTENPLFGDVETNS